MVTIDAALKRDCRDEALYESHVPTLTLDTRQYINGTHVTRLLTIWLPIIVSLISQLKYPSSNAVLRG